MDGYQKLASEAAVASEIIYTSEFSSRALSTYVSVLIFFHCPWKDFFSPGGRKELTKITLRAACLYLASKQERRVVRYE